MLTLTLCAALTPQAQLTHYEPGLAHQVARADSQSGAEATGHRLASRTSSHSSVSSEDMPSPHKTSLPRGADSSEFAGVQLEAPRRDKKKKISTKVKDSSMEERDEETGTLYEMLCRCFECVTQVWCGLMSRYRLYLTWGLYFPFTMVNIGTRLKSGIVRPNVTPASEFYCKLNVLCLGLERSGFHCNSLC